MEEPLDVEIPDKLFFRIGELAEIVGVEPHVLRYWEQEFRMRPQRSPSGQRMYRRKDISRFLRIRNLLYKQGFTIPGARRVLADARKGDAVVAVSDPEQVDAARKRIDEIREHIARSRRQFQATWNTYLNEDG